MTYSSETDLLQRLKDLIEQQLQWGEIAHWRSYDFEKLSDRIYDKTGVALSVSTLKRFLGKVSYGSSPSVTTLNTLSQFVGYDDWRTFSNAFPNGKEISPEVTGEQKEAEVIPEKQQSRSFPRIVFVIFAVILAGFSIVQLLSARRVEPTYSFSSKTILTEGLPNSVIFDYDASAAGKNDSVFIVQSWDTRRRVAVSRSDRHHSSIYYYPGYFKAKLMVGDKIMKEHDIQIRTNGWLGLIEAEWRKEPLYFKQEEIVRDEGIVVDDALLEKYNISTAPEPPPVRLYNQQDIRGILTDNFTFETELKTNPGKGNNACQRVEVLLQSKNDILIIPLVNPACVGDIYLAAYGFYTDSKKEDLSGFGYPLSDWVKLKVVCEKRKMRFFVQDKEVFSAAVSNDPTEIVGVQYRFKGAGAVRNTRLSGERGKAVVF